MNSYEFSRTDRINEQVKRELSVLIRNEVKDPRVTQVSILEVRVTKDLSKAKVYFDTLDDENAQKCEISLNHAANFLRNRLGRLMNLRMIPQLFFIYDETEKEANELSKMIDKAIASDNK